METKHEVTNTSYSLLQIRQPPNLHELDSRIPKSLSLVIAKMLHKSADKRYQCGRGIVMDLLHCQRVVHSRQATSIKGQGQDSSTQAITIVNNLQEEESTFEPGRHDVSDVFCITPNKLYGREPDLKILLETYNRACSSSKSQMILITGYAGT